MAVTYEQVAAQASELSEAERWRLATELLSSPPGRAQKSASEYFGINGPVRDDVDARIRRGREE